MVRNELTYRPETMSTLCTIAVGLGLITLTQRAHTLDVYISGKCEWGGIGGHHTSNTINWQWKRVYLPRIIACDRPAKCSHKSITHTHTHTVHNHLMRMSLSNWKSKDSFILFVLMPLWYWASDALTYKEAVTFYMILFNRNFFFSNWVRGKKKQQAFYLNNISSFCRKSKLHKTKKKIEL